MLIVLRIIGAYLTGEFVFSTRVQCYTCPAIIFHHEVLTMFPSPKRYDTMTYRRTGRSGLLLPAVSLGLWHNFGGVDTLENARAMIRRSFDLGITHFDLANNYGPPPGSAEE